MHLNLCMPSAHRLPETTNATNNNKCYSNQKADIGSKYLPGNILPRISLIRGKLFPEMVFTSYSRLLISTGFVVVSRVGCLGVTAECSSQANTAGLDQTPQHAASDLGLHYLHWASGYFSLN